MQKDKRSVCLDLITSISPELMKTRMLHVPQLVGPRPHCCLPSNPDYREDGEVSEAANERKEEKTCSQGAADVLVFSESLTHPF